MDVGVPVRPVEILLVEDSPNDVQLTIEAFKEGKIRANIHAVVDGVEALNFIRRQGKYADAVTPDLILLDLNMPRKDGRSVLSEIKSDEALKHIPVIVLTTSAASEDILNSYRLHANSYITKPVDLDQFFDAISSLGDYWLELVKLPRDQEHDR